MDIFMLLTSITVVKHGKQTCMPSVRSMAFVDDEFIYVGTEGEATSIVWN